jgi:LmbE family N-acetylglucosaminyl deacetylase
MVADGDLMNVLAFFAHPDDETMLCGGTLALLAQGGAQVHFLSATRGEGGEAGEPPLTTHDRLGQVRADEMGCAVQVLGGSSLTFFDYVDPRVGPDNELYAYSQDVDELARQVAELIRQLNIDALISHGSNGEYGHPAHLLTHQAAYLAVERLAEDGAAPLFYGASAAFPEHPRPFLTNRDDPAHLVVDIRPVLSHKTQAAMCHRTQHALFVRRASEEAGRPLSVADVIIKLEGIHRAYPPVVDGINDPLAKILQPFEYKTQIE